VGATLAAHLVIPGDLPEFDLAAMDGYAVAGDGPWRVIDVTGSRAGHPWPGRLRPGDAVPIATGGVVPVGTVAVLPVEDSALIGDELRAGIPAPGRHIRRAGEDARAGEVLVPAGTRITPALVGLASSARVATLTVRRPPNLTVVVTGDELIGNGPGCVPDALGPMLPSLAESLGGTAVQLSRVGDDVDLGPLLREATTDVVVVTGSTSVGRSDRLRPALHDLRATLLVDGVNCRPGHPMLLARLGDSAAAPGRQTWVVGLPGNPYAAFVAAHTLLGPLFAGLTGRRLPPLPRARLIGPPAPRSASISGARPVPPALTYGSAASGPTRIVPVQWTIDGAGVRPCPGAGAAFLRGAARADALAIVLPGRVAPDDVALVVL
jgi:molybdopterin molybdotransferase